jgi:ubiquinol oxidase
MRFTILFSFLACSASAFQVVPAPRTFSRQVSLRAESSGEPKEVATTDINAGVVKAVDASPTPAVAAAAAVAVAVADSPSTSTASQGQSMDENIYKINKTIIDSVYEIICFFYPVKGTERDFARFYVLETVARVPYFAYLSVMHLRETFGERHDTMSERMRTHYAEADNELHHLLIMESMGGNSNVVDRTLAQAMAFGYYWYVVLLYTFNEPAAYHLSELIEDHAYNTYNTFLNNYEKRLKGMSVPEIARKYYEKDNPFLFDLFCTVKAKDDDGLYSTRRPELNSLYDVFVNIRDDEKEHWKTLCNLVQFDDMNAVDASQVESTKPMPAPN